MEKKTRSGYGIWRRRDNITFLHVFEIFGVKIWKGKNKETGDIEIFNQVLNNLKLKENNLVDINSLQKSYSSLKKDIQNKPSVDEQQSILDAARQMIFDKLLKK